jgi:TonB family protein
MNRLEQKCLLGSVGMHGLLVLLLVVGSAFFVPEGKAPAPPPPPLNVVPDFLIDQALAGGGGNPNVKPEEGRQKGNTLDKPPELPPPPKKAPETKPPPETKPVDTKPEQTAKPKDTKPDRSFLKELAKPPSNRTSPEALPEWLKPVSAADQKKAAAEETARQWAASLAAARTAIGKSKVGLQDLRRGFNDGTVVEPYGPGGAAYAPYAAFVKAVYDNAWAVQDLSDESATCVARVTIAHNGDVLTARIITPSGNSVLDQSVRRVLSAVRFVAPFPQGAPEKERSFTINFNLKSKRGLG